MEDQAQKLEKLLKTEYNNLNLAYDKQKADQLQRYPEVRDTISLYLFFYDTNTNMMQEHLYKQ